MNKFIGIGNISSDLELRTTPNGKSVCNFNVAFQRSYKNQEGKYDADFFPVVVWDKKAESCAKYLEKGKKVAIEGSMETRSYEAKDGTKRYITEIKARNVEFLSPVGDRADDAPQITSSIEPRKPSGDDPF